MSVITLHAAREAFLDGHLQLCRRHPIPKLAGNSFFAGWDGIFTAFGDDESAALNTGNVRRISAGKPAVSIYITSPIRVLLRIWLDGLLRIRLLPIFHFGKRLEHALLDHHADERGVLLVRAIAYVNVAWLTKAHALFDKTPYLTIVRMELTSLSSLTLIVSEKMSAGFNNVLW